MTRMLFTLVCLGVLGTATGGYFDPALSGVSTSVGVGVGIYVDEDPYWEHPYWHDDWYDDWPYRRYRRFSRDVMCRSLLFLTLPTLG